MQPEQFELEIIDAWQKAKEWVRKDSAPETIYKKIHEQPNPACYLGSKNEALEQLKRAVGNLALGMESVLPIMWPLQSLKKNDRSLFNAAWQTLCTLAQEDKTALKVLKSVGIALSTPSP